MFASLVQYDNLFPNLGPGFPIVPPSEAGRFIRPDEPAKPNVLIAEDDIILRRLLTNILERAQYQVVAVANGAEAVRAFQQHKFDLVMLDIMMPVMDGFAACTQIRGLSTIPILLLSAFSSKDVKHHARRSGASLFLNKPVRPAELKQHIQALLQPRLFATSAFD